MNVPLTRPPLTRTVYVYARELAPRSWRLILDANSAVRSVFQPLELGTVDTVDADADALDEIELALIGAGWMRSAEWEPSRNGVGFVAWVEPWHTR